MGLLGKLFGGGKAKAAAEPEASEPVEHEGFTIVAAPIKEGSQYRTAGTIRREIDGEPKTVRFIRADNHGDRQAAIDHSVRKAQQIIAEQGMGMFDRENV